MKIKNKKQLPAFLNEKPIVFDTGPIDISNCPGKGYMSIIIDELNAWNHYRECMKLIRHKSDVVHLLHELEKHKKKTS